MPEHPIEAYRAYLRRYAETLDLMSPKGLERLDEHLADAKTYARTILTHVPHAKHVLDVGSGAGLPGLIIAAELPGVHVEMVERRKKRATFLRGAAAAMGLRNAHVVGADVTQSQGPSVEVVTAQAVAPFADVYDWTAHRHQNPVVLISRKGPEFQKEVEELASRTGKRTTIMASEARPNRGTLLAVQTAGGQSCPS